MLVLLGRAFCCIADFVATIGHNPIVAEGSQHELFLNQTALQIMSAYRSIIHRIPSVRSPPAFQVKKPRLLGGRDAC
jgi:hypothetical protein